MHILWYTENMNINTADRNIATIDALFEELDLLLITGQENTLDAVAVREAISARGFSTERF